MDSTDGLDTCDHCGASIRWTLTASGARMAVGTAPDPTGNTAVYRDAAGTWRSRRPTDEYPAQAYERLVRPHVADCTTPPRRTRIRPTRPRPHRYQPWRSR